MIFWVRSSGWKAEKFCTFHTKLPLYTSPLVVGAPPPRSEARVKVTPSLRMVMSVDTCTTSPGRRKPCLGSSTEESAAKSHHPWLRFLAEKRCQESRRTLLASSATLRTARR